MDTRNLFPHKILQDTIGKSCTKSEFSIKMLMILSFLGGDYVDFGYLACLHIISGISAGWDGLTALLGAPVFPITLICILIGGGELATGNMIITALGKLTGRVNTHKLVRNQLIISLGSLADAAAMAYFLGRYIGLTEGPAAAKTIAITEARVNMDFGRVFVSTITCNQMVCMGIWFYFSTRHTSGRILVMWFPIMIFILTGFQHFIANMFIIPAGIWAGVSVNWDQFLCNMIPVFLDNVLGGSSFVAASYLFAYKHLLKDSFST